MRRRAYALLILAAIVLAGDAASHLNAQTSSRVDAITARSRSAYDEWLGPARSASMQAIDPASIDDHGSMAIEARVAYHLAIERFGHLREADAFMLDGAAWYLQSRVVEQAFNEQYRTPGYRHYTTCVLDCLIPIVAPSLTLSRWSEGLGRAEFLRAQSNRRWPPLDRRWVPPFSRPFGRALAFGALEREIGWPALQGALRVLAQADSDAGAMKLLEDATGRPLAAVFDAAIGAPTDHRVLGVSEIDSPSCRPPACRTTQVSIARGGGVPLPLTLRVTFADGTIATSLWNGTEEHVTFESAAPAIRAELDPDRVWLLDANYADNTFETNRSTNVPVVKWLARWVVWMQHAMLTYSFPI